MKTIALAILAILNCGISICQQDSLFISVFVSPVEDLIIEEQDSLVVVDEALLINGLDEQFDYSFLVAGYDTLTVNSFEISFSDTEGESISETFTISDIDLDPEDTLERFGDTVLLSFGEYGFIDIYEYSVVMRDENGDIIISMSDFYIDEE